MSVDGRLFNIVSRYCFLSGEEEEQLGRLIDDSYDLDYPTAALVRALAKTSSRVQEAYGILTGHLVSLLAFPSMPGAELFTQHLKVLGETVTIIKRMGALRYLEVHSTRAVLSSEWNKVSYVIMYLPESGMYGCFLEAPYAPNGASDVMFHTLKAALRYARKHVVKLPPNTSLPKAKVGWFWTVCDWDFFQPKLEEVEMVGV